MDLSHALQVEAELQRLSPEAIRQTAATLLSSSLEDFSRESWRVLGEKGECTEARYWGCMCEYLTGVSLGRKRRLIINVMPRSGKSLLTTVIWPAWQWARDSGRSKWLFCSHACDLSLLHAVKRRNLLESSWYRYFFPEVVLARDQNQKQEFASTNGGTMFSTFISGATGRGCDFLVIDDPHNLNDAYSPTALETTNNFVRQSLFSRLNDQQRGAIVLIMQRIHENDLTGELLNPSPEPEMKPAELKNEPPRTGYEMFTRALRVFR